VVADSLKEFLGVNPIFFVPKAVGVPDRIDVVRLVSPVLEEKDNPEVGTPVVLQF
jgi:hypothetical protein